MNNAKQKLRKELLSIRKALSADQVNTLSQSICNYLLHASFFDIAQHVGYYSSINNEVSLSTLITAVSKNFYLPKIVEDKLVFCRDSGIYYTNIYHILEPCTDTSIAIEQLDLILLPLVGFDTYGNRLGMGRAFYDKLLNNAKKPPLLVGVSYAFQQKILIPCEPHDKKLDYIVTENGIWNCKNQCYDNCQIN